MQKTEEFYRVKKKRLLLTLFLAFVSFFIFLPLLTYYYFAPDLTSKEAIMNRNDRGVILLDRKGQPFFSFYQAKFKTFAPLDQVSLNMQNAVIASEDRDFYKHPGFSFKGIIRAFFANLTHKEIAQGGSTLTQQLVKNSLLTAKKDYMRKYQEVILAMEVERKFSKKEILEMYLNSVYFGEGAFGVEEAASVYFGKDAKDLNLAEAAILAGILPSPSAYSPISGDPEKAKARQKLVLQNMVAQKYITQAQMDEALNTKLVYNQTKEQINNIAPHFALMVMDELIKNYGEEQVIRSGMKVKTTLDRDFQEYAEGIVKDQVANLAPNKVTNGAAVVIDPKTGEILVLVGSKDWYDEKFGKVNMATTPRQPGSSYKPIIYVNALERRLITPATILPDRPTTFPGNYKPLDYDKKFRGEVTAGRALANSLNIPSVAVMEKVGLMDGLEFSKRAGITTLGDSSNYGLSLVLGTAEVPLVDMTSVYSMFANEGVRNEPFTIQEIRDKQGKVIYTAATKSESVVSPQAAFLISSILSDNKARQEEFGNTLTISRTAAVKTGTTENYVDAWTLGYTPSITVGVWVGNNDHKPMDQIAGSLGAAPIWKALMEHYLAGTSVEEFEVPSGVNKVSVCTTVTKPPEEKDKDSKQTTYTSYTEYFIAGTEPSNVCGKVSGTPTPSISLEVTPTIITPSPTIESKPSPTQAPTSAQHLEIPTPTALPTPTIRPTNTPSVSASPTP